MPEDIVVVLQAMPLAMILYRMLVPASLSVAETVRLSLVPPILVVMVGAVTSYERVFVVVPVLPPVSVPETVTTTSPSSKVCTSVAVKDTDHLPEALVVSVLVRSAVVSASESSSVMVTVVPVASPEEVPLMVTALSSSVALIRSSPAIVAMVSVGASVSMVKEMPEAVP